MAEFVFLYSGGGDMPEGEAEQAGVMKAWTDWFGTIGKDLKDGGNPFGHAKTVSSDGSIRDGAPAALSGYSIVTATSLDAAAGIAKASPVLQGGGSVHVFEVIPM
jgi:hypothetical protein